MGLLNVLPRTASGRRHVIVSHYHVRNGVQLDTTVPINRIGGNLFDSDIFAEIILLTISLTKGDNSLARLSPVSIPRWAPSLVV